MQLGVANLRRPRSKGWVRFLQGAALGDRGTASAHAFTGLARRASERERQRPCGVGPPLRRRGARARQVDFMRHHQLPYEAAEGDELERLRPALVAVQEALGNFAFAGSVRDGASRDAFFKARARARGAPAPRRPR